MSAETLHTAGDSGSHDMAQHSPADLMSGVLVSKTLDTGYVRPPASCGRCHREFRTSHDLCRRAAGCPLSCPARGQSPGLSEQARSRARRRSEQSPLHAWHRAGGRPRVVFGADFDHASMQAQLRTLDAQTSLGRAHLFSAVRPCVPAARRSATSTPHWMPVTRHVQSLLSACRRTGKGGGPRCWRLAPHFALLHVVAARLRQARDEHLPRGDAWSQQAKVQNDRFREEGTVWSCAQTQTMCSSRAVQEAMSSSTT